MTTPLISVERLVYHYDQEIPALNGIDLAVADNAYVAIVGQNGSGKTTLVKHMNGLLLPTDGRVLVDGIDTRTSSVSALARTVGYAFQNPDHQIFCASTREEIAFGPRNLGLADGEVRERVDDALAAFGLTEMADVPPAVLGFGLRRKVAVAAVCAMQPKVLILDEPTAGLDHRSVSELMVLVDAHHASGRTVIVVTHDMRLVAEHARGVVVMHDGRILAQGAPADVFQQQDVLAQAQLFPPQITQLAQQMAENGIFAGTLSVDEFVEEWRRLLKRGRA